MRLREKLKSFWPPGWSGSYGKGTQFLTGEPEGLILKEVNQVSPSTISISVGFLGKEGSFSATFTRAEIARNSQDDPEFFDRLYNKLKNSIGQEIRQIGDSEI